MGLLAAGQALSSDQVRSASTNYDHCRKSKSFMKKNILMLTGFAVVLAAAIACFTPAPKPQETSRATPRVHDNMTLAQEAAEVRSALAAAWERVPATFRGPTQFMGRQYAGVARQSVQCRSAIFIASAVI
jgi:hypothetical protein